MAEGELKYRVTFDTSQVANDIDKVVDEVLSAGNKMETATESITKLFADIPTTTSIDIDTGNIDQVNAALGQLESTYAQNTDAIRILEDEHARLIQKAKEYSEQGEPKDQVQAILKTASALKLEAGLRKEVLTELKKSEEVLRKHAKALNENGNETKSLRTQIKELENAMAQMRAEAMAEGRTLDENSGAYAEMKQRLGELKDIRGDIAKQGSVLANDEAVYAGVMSGIQGVTGGFTALQGAITLFGKESDDVQKAMMKLQAAMSITMGLQQVAQMLNKDSALRLTIVSGLKQWWNKILVESAVVQTAETVAEEANTVATEANTIATEQNAVAKGAATAATGASVAATGAATVANWTLAGAFRAVGVAIKSIPVFGWVLAGVSVLIGIWQHFQSEAEKTAEKFKEQQELLKPAREEYAKASLEIENYIKRIDEFNGTAHEEKVLVEELNRKYADQMGECQSLAKWKENLAQKGDAYCQVLMKEAQAQAVLSKYTEAYIALEEAKSADYSAWYRISKAQEEGARQKAIRERQAEVDKWAAEWRKLMQEAEDLKRDFKLDNYAPKKSTSSGGGSKSTKVDTSEQEKQAVDKLGDMLVAIRRRKQELELKVQKEGVQSAADLRQKAYEEEMEDLRNEKDAKLKELEEEQKRIYEQKYNGKKKWEGSDAQKNFLNWDKFKELGDYYDAVIELTHQRQVKDEAELLANAKTAWANATNNYLIMRQSIEDKMEADMAKAETEWDTKRIKAEGEAALAALDYNNLKKTARWDEVFNDLLIVATPRLIDLSNKLMNALQLKGLSDDMRKEIVEGIKNINVELNDRSKLWSKFRNQLSGAGADVLGFFDMSKRKQELDANIESQKQIVIEAFKEAGQEISPEDIFLGMDTSGLSDKLQGIVNSALGDMAASQNEANEIAGKLDPVAQVGNILDLTTANLQGLKKLKDEMVSWGFFDKDSGFAKGIDSIAEASEHISNAFKDALSLNAFGVIADIGGAVSSIFDSFANFLGLGADYSEYNKLMDKYKGVVDIWSELINRKSEYINIKYGEEGDKALADAQKYLQAEKDVARELALSRLGSGAGAFSHSIGYRMWQGSYDWNGINWRDVAAQVSVLTGTQFRGMEDFLNMTTEQLWDVKAEFAGLWGAMDEDFRKYLEQLMEYGDKADDIIEQEKEMLTGISFDGFYDDFISTLTDMDSSAADFANNFSKYLEQGILTSLVADKYKSRIEALYDEWSLGARDGLSASELATLRAKQQDLVAEMLADRKQWEQVFEETGMSASATTGVSNSASQDSIDEVNGRLTAMQITTEQTRNLCEEMRNLSLMSVGHLENIASNTAMLYETNERLARIEDYTSRL